MTEPAPGPALGEAILEIGPEDLIALPEIPGMEEPRGFAHGSLVSQISDALFELMKEGRVQVWAGHWFSSKSRAASVQFKGGSSRALLPLERREYLRVMVVLGRDNDWVS